ncbi:MAG: phosphatidylserine decarboxylase family protein [Syntrophaceae bacterium]|nr:phosphatidylserine decarboxylase family protein [Syntrophaceae bacterium]
MKDNKIPIAIEGWPFILPPAIAAVLLFAFDCMTSGFIFIALTFCFMYFFRDPQRSAPEGTNLVVSPADGKIVAIKDSFESDYLNKQTQQISIFLSILDVHVNRFPISGLVETIDYHQGKFNLAFLERASLENERTAMVIADGNRKILVTQIAGFIARRIVCHAQPGDWIQRGKRYGMICFGSRVDIFLPKDTELKVKLGDKVKGAKDIIAVLK